ncbi:MAG: tannase/feruloyl esterase family alpha/beta hydrolase [Asticcacaulis sp.]|uniref:tannase/feruloyl esterase family alpha/beta hydrolase n=1 Tax=Asticcacaulis sp. TaxID=1872648 RepID=UPI0039E5E072
MFKPVAFVVVCLGLIVCTPGFAASPSLASSGLKDLTPVSAAMPCEQLARTDFESVPDAPTRISKAQVQTDDKTGAEFCRVTGFVSPQVQFELRLPTKTWTQRLLMTGCGGLCGNIGLFAEHADSCLPLQRGEMAIVATDMGHEGQGGLWAKDDLLLRTDFAYRGVHVVTLAAKAIIAKYYGQPQAYAYFSGCSDGGREALMEAQRFPTDFDGITAGAPAANFVVQNSFYHAWNAVKNTGPDGQQIFNASRVAILHAAVLRACDTLDGQADGLISDPTQCHFDPATIQCQPGAATDACLTSAEVAVAKAFYEGAHDDQGNRFVTGGLQPGSELAWVGVEISPIPGMPPFGAMAAGDATKYLLNWPSLPTDWSVLTDFTFDKATFDKVTASYPLYNATNPDLSAYFSRGGKLIMWHGWSDPHISPTNSIAYYRGVEATVGAQATRDHMRFYLFPGLYHCGGGDGLNTFDILTPVMAWVEGAKQPEALQASHVEQKGMPGMMGPPSAPPVGTKGAPPLAPSGQSSLDTVRPAPVVATVMISPYPLLADFKGKTKVANGYALYTPLSWAGDHLFKPYKAQTCGWTGNTYACETNLH